MGLIYFKWLFENFWTKFENLEMMARLKRDFTPLCAHGGSTCMGKERRKESKRNERKRRSARVWHGRKGEEKG